LRLEAARHLGLARVPVLIADDLSEEKVRAYRLADNRTHDETLWDDELLGLELRDLQALACDLGLTAFDPRELQGFMEPEAGDRDGGKGIDPEEEWRGMPEFHQERKGAYRTITVHLRDEAAVRAFSALVGQPLSERTRFIWFPQIGFRCIG
jgi:hypothetical protein